MKVSTLRIFALGFMIIWEFLAVCMGGEVHIFIVGSVIFHPAPANRKKHMACCKKYKPYILKYVPYVLKYVPYVLK